MINAHTQTTIRDQNYQVKLFALLQDYIYQLEKAPPEVADFKDTIFINSEDIFFFHKV